MNAFFCLLAGAVVWLAPAQATPAHSAALLSAPLGSELEGDQLETQARNNGDALIPTCRFEGAQCGYLDRGGSTAIAPEFDWSDRFVDGRAVVLRDGKYGVIDVTGRFVIAAAYDSMSRFDRGQALALVGDRLGVIDQEGRWIVPAEHGLIVRLSEDSFLVAEPPYVHAGGPLRPLSDRLVRMHPYAYGKRWGIVAGGGSWIMHPTFAQVIALSDDLNGLFWASDSSGMMGRWQLMGLDGKPVSSELFDFVEQIQPGQDRAVVKRGGKWGAINGKGEIAVDLKFDWLGYFRDGWAPYRLAGQEGRIDRDGNVLADKAAPEPARDPDALTRPLPSLPRLPWSEGLAQHLDDATGKFGFVDPTGKFVIAPQFDAVGPFKYGVAWAAFPERREWCVIDKAGHIKPGTKCHCGQPLVIVEHQRPSAPEACYADGIRIVRGLGASHERAN